ncbi:hypothetical protein ID0436_14100 [Helicobacter pylori]
MKKLYGRMPYLGVHLTQVYIIYLQELQRRLVTEKLVLQSNEKSKDIVEPTNFYHHRT